MWYGMVFWFAFGRTYYEKKKGFSNLKNICKLSDFCLEFAIFVGSPEQFIQTVKGQNNFWEQNAFLTCSWRFLIPNKLEQLKFKLEKIIGI